MRKDKESQIARMRHSQCCIALGSMGPLAQALLVITGRGHPPAAPCSPAGRSHRPHGSLRTPGARGLDAQAARRVTRAIQFESF